MESRVGQWARSDKYIYVELAPFFSWSRKRSLFSQLIQQSGQIQENEPLKMQTYSTKKKDPYVQKTLARYPVFEFLFSPDSRKGVLKPNPKKEMRLYTGVD
jgi:hypothetical protein